MKIPQPDVLVIGAGVSGLTTAVCLAEAGYRVRVRSAVPPTRTTSIVAGAIWMPYLVAGERVRRWGLETLGQLSFLAGADAGVRMVGGIEAARSTVDPPEWAAELEDFSMCPPYDLPAGYTTGWWYRTPVVDMPTYLDYLAARLAAAGGGLEFGLVAALEDAATRAPILVNCAGIGARSLVPDHGVVPVNGQVVVVDNPGIESFFADHDDSPDFTYIVPHAKHVVLGGTAYRGRSDVVPDAAVTEAIVRRCALIQPMLTHAPIRAVRVGVRPSRSQVRLELAEFRGRHVIHNYGHGGAGVTLSWGCAREVLDLVRTLA